MLLRASRLSLAALLLLQVAGTPLMAQTLVGDGTMLCGEPYVVQPGDTLSELSQRAYGTSRLYDQIVAANDDQLRGDPNLLAVGMSIDIPCLDASGEASSVDIGTAIAAEGPLSTAELDALFGPVALFPDTVLTPLLVAVTYPLDVVKAGRFVEESAALSDAERATAASNQDWDPTVRQLAAGFPDLVTRMSDHIDWTEQAGEAVLAQTDDVLDAVQRLRTTAMDNGYLVDNPAQDVEVVNETIAIAPAQPGVVYVPTYDTQVVYTTPITTSPQFIYGYDYDDDYDNYDDDWEDALVAGGIILGGAIILDEIFDDNDWGDVGGWGDDDVSIDWDQGDINIDRGDIDIDRGDITVGGGDRVNIDGGDRTTIGNGDRTTIGDGDRPDRDNVRTIGSGNDTASRDAARQQIEQRQSRGGEVARLPADRPAASRPRAETRPAASNRQAQVSRPTEARRPTTSNTQRAQTPSRSRSNNAMASPSRQRASPSSNRGRQSAQRSGGRRR